MKKIYFISSKKALFLFLVLFFAFSGSFCHAQKLALKTDILYDALTVPSLGAECRIDSTKTVDISCIYNPISYPGYHHWKVLAFRPEFRFWNFRAFSGLFVGIHALFLQYNVSRMPFSLFCDGDKRYQGTGLGGGISVGYCHILSPHWGLETGISFGCVHLDYDRYRCGACGNKEEHSHTMYIGPTGLNVSLLYILK